MFNNELRKDLKALNEKILSLEVNKETPYKESKEFLDRQQNIDYLLVLTRLFLETPYNTDLQKDIATESGKQIQRMLEKFKSQ